jgi:glycosyltransferase involved in cell wall biosynthesis
MRKLSAVVITRNEERDIGHTLDALAFADEVVVVDSCSTDRTADLCRGRGARVIERAFDGYGPQKRFAVAQATHDWVLCIDADEVVSPELAASIRAVLAGEPACAAYALRFHTVFMGRVLTRGCSEAHVRLFDRRRARWNDASVHERVEVAGPTGLLAGFVLHATARDLSEAIQKLDLYTTRSALELHARGARPRSLASIVASSAFHFFKHWILRGLVLNGVPGFAWAMLFAIGSAVKHFKVLQLAATSRPAPAQDEPCAPALGELLRGVEPGQW